MSMKARATQNQAMISRLMPWRTGRLDSFSLLGFSFFGSIFTFQHLIYCVARFHALQLRSRISRCTLSTMDRIVTQGAWLRLFELADKCEQLSGFAAATIQTPGVYSVRRARIGSSVAARQAGTRQAATATSKSKIAEPNSVSGSRELPFTHDATTPLSAMLRPRPMATPKPSIVPVDASTRRMMLVLGAPRAIRMPTSWVL